jgi:quercetin dioxygenase-like cupin family protein
MLHQGPENTDHVMLVLIGGRDGNFLGQPTRFLASVSDKPLRELWRLGCKASVAVYRVELGTVSPPERHTEEQGNYFIGGRMEWTVGEGDTQRSYICEPGTLLVVAPNEPHSSRVLGEDEVLMLSFFGPPRESHRNLATAEADCH